ncbi:DUF2924 domain-containing protein [Bartonella sp. DGB2]|uniref:DUF2924 domain-containing protein n=1 Tax=Bartonella sp. DGB2 TaxID=3388426 RepID=UPI003990263E
MSCKELEQEIAGLRDAPMRDLKTLWRAYFNEEVQSRNKASLVMKLAYRMQEVEYAGLSEQTRAFLLDENSTKPKRARKRQAPVVGMQLQREYLGQMHHATVVQNGYQYEGQIYKSLSAIAKHITGTNWNGHLFFGLVRRG